MSYVSVSQTPNIEPRPLRGAAFRDGTLGGLIGMDLSKSAYYVALVETFDNKLGLRKYSWSPIKWLDNFSAMSFDASLRKTTPSGYTTSTLYEWKDGRWQSAVGFIGSRIG